MTLEIFKQLIDKQKKQDKKIRAAYELKIDLLDFVDSYAGITALLITEIYGKEGYDWYRWFCFEMDYCKSGANAWGENKNPICYDIESLWQHLESLKNK